MAGEGASSVLLMLEVEPSTATDLPSSRPFEPDLPYRGRDPSGIQSGIVWEWGREREPSRVAIRRVCRWPSPDEWRRVGWMSTMMRDNPWLRVLRLAAVLHNGRCLFVPPGDVPPPPRALILCVRALSFPSNSASGR